MAAGYAERFVNRGVVVQIVVDAIAPHIAPAIGAEQSLDGLLGVVVIDIDGLLVDQKRHRVVGDEAVILEGEGERFDVRADDRHGDFSRCPRCTRARINWYQRFAFPPNPSLRAKRSNPYRRKRSWIASSLALLATTLNKLSSL